MKTLNVRGKQGFDNWLASQDVDVLDAFPAQQLIQVADDMGSRNWPETWVAAGGQMFGQRMVALKWDLIWERISLFGLPYPPFDHFDNMDVEDVSREEAEQLGLLDSQTKVFQQKRQWRDDVKRLIAENPALPPIIQPQLPPLVRAQKRPLSANTKQSIRAVFGAAVIVGILIWFGWSSINAPLSTPNGSITQSDTKPRDPGADAYYTGRKACERMLKAPASAKFSNPNLDSATGWQPHGYLSWKVFGYVDAQNSFGAMLRQNWEAVVQVNTGRLEVVYLRLGDEKSGSLPPVRKAPLP